MKRKGIKLLSLLLTLVMVLGLLPGGLALQAEAASVEGDGSHDNPYQITADNIDDAWDIISTDTQRDDFYYKLAGEITEIRSDKQINLTLPAYKHVYLDLNGHIFNYVGQADSALTVASAAADSDEAVSFEISDSGFTGGIYATNATNADAAAVRFTDIKYGTLTVTGGTLEGKKYGIFGKNYGNAPATINVSDNASIIGETSIYSNGATVSVNGGKYKGPFGYQAYSSTRYSSSFTVISGLFTFDPSKISGVNVSASSGVENTGSQPYTKKVGDASLFTIIKDGQQIDYTNFVSLISDPKNTGETSLKIAGTLALNESIPVYGTVDLNFIGDGTMEYKGGTDSAFDVQNGSTLNISGGGLTYGGTGNAITVEGGGTLKITDAAKINLTAPSAVGIYCKDNGNITIEGVTIELTKDNDGNMTGSAIEHKGNGDIIIRDVTIIYNQTDYPIHLGSKDYTDNTLEVKSGNDKVGTLAVLTEQAGGVLTEKKLSEKDGNSFVGAKAGERVLLGVSPETGYYLDTLTVEDNTYRYRVTGYTVDENGVELKKDHGDIYSFYMPANQNVVVSATFREGPATAGPYKIYGLSEDGETILPDENNKLTFEKGNTLALNPSIAKRGTTVTVTAQNPLTENGLTVFYDGGSVLESVSRAQDNPNQYTFTMPESDVYLYPEFARQTVTPSAYFVDVAGPAASKVNIKGGVKDDGTANPNDTIEFEVTGEKVTINVLNLKTQPQKNNGVYSFTMPKSSVVIYAGLQAGKYNIEVKEAANGTAVSSYEIAPAGTTVTLVPSPDKGYRLTGFDIKDENNNPVLYEIVQGEYRFKMPAANVTVTPAFESVPVPAQVYKIQYQITGGSGSLGTAFTAIPGREVELAPTPANGYLWVEGSLTATTASGKPVTITNNKFTMPKDNVVVTGSFTPKDLNVNVAPKEAVITVKGSQSSTTAHAGELITFSVTGKDESTYLSHLGVQRTVNGVQEPVEFVLVDGSYRFTMPAADVVISATYSKNPVYGIDIINPNPASGTYTANEKEDPDPVAKGAKVLLSAAPNEGYQFNGWSVTDDSGQPVAVANNAFTMPGSHVTVVPIISSKYQIATQAEGGGHLLLLNETAYNGGSVQFSAQADSGYRLIPSTLTVTDASGKNVLFDLIQKKNLSFTPESAGTVYSFRMPAQDVVIHATFEKEATRYLVGVDATVFGTATPSVWEATAGQNVKIAAIPDGGFRVKSLLLAEPDTGNIITGTEIKPTVNDEKYNYEFTMPAKSVMIVAEFETIPPAPPMPERSVTIAVDATTKEKSSNCAATIDGETTTVATVGSTVLVEVAGDNSNTPEYVFDHLIVEPAETNPNAFKKFSTGKIFVMPDADVKVTAYFRGITTESPIKVTGPGRVILESITIVIDDSGFIYDNGNIIGWVNPDKQEWTRDGTKWVIKQKEEHDISVYVMDENGEEVTDRGTAKGSKDTAVKGDVVRFMLSPAQGYAVKRSLSGILETSGNVSADKRDTFTMPGEKVEVGVTFIGGLTANALNRLGGTVTVNPAVNLYPNQDNIKVTVEVRRGYQLTGLTANNGAKIKDSSGAEITEFTPVTGTQEYILKMGSANTTVMPTYKVLPAYSVSVVRDGTGFGTADVSSSTEVLEGDTITLKVGPDKVSRIKDVQLYRTADDGTRTLIAGQPTAAQGTNPTTVKNPETVDYTFTMPASNVLLLVTFEKDPAEIEYAVATEVAEGSTGSGTVTASPSSAKAGAEITITVAPEDGSVLDKVEGAYKDSEGATKKITLTQDTDNKNQYTFTMPAADVTVTATFTEAAPDTYSVIINDTENGTVTAQPESGLKEGDTVTLTVRPANGYELDTLKVMKENTTEKVDISQGAETSTFTMPASNVEVTATFKKKVYSITKVVDPSSDGFSFEFSPDQTSWKENDSVLITAIGYPSDYDVDTVKAVNDTTSDEIEITDNSFRMPASNVTVTITFKKVEVTKYNVTVADTTNGTVTADKTNGLSENDTVTLTVTPDKGYELESLTAVNTDDASVKVEIDANNSFKMPAGNVTVTATFKKVEVTTYKVTVAPTENGTVAADKTSDLNENDTVILTVEPAPDYELESLTYYKDGTPETTIKIIGNSFRMPASDVTVTATFKEIPKTYNVTVMEAEGGTVTANPDSGLSGNGSETVTLTIQPNAAAGYELNAITATDADGKAVTLSGADGDLVRTFTMPAKDVTVTAAFVKVPTVYQAVFKTPDGTVVDTVPFIEGDASLSEPKAPDKVGHVFEWTKVLKDGDTEPDNWAKFDLSKANTNLTITGEYTPLELGGSDDDDVKPPTPGNDVTYDPNKGAVTIHLSASSEAKIIELVGEKAKPVDVVMVLDQSGSMGNKLEGNKTRNQALKEAAKTFVDLVYQNATEKDLDHRIALVGFAYGAGSSYKNTGLLATTSKVGLVKYDQITNAQYKDQALLPVKDKKADLEKAIDNVVASGATASDTGLKIAKNIFAAQTGENDVGKRDRIVLFITDGIPTSTGYFSESPMKTTAAAALAEAYEMKQNQNVTIYSIGIEKDLVTPTDTTYRGDQYGYIGTSSPKYFDLNHFLHYVSSNYPDAQKMSDYYTGKNKSYNSTNPDAGYYMEGNKIADLESNFQSVLYSSVVQVAPFDKATLSYTITKDFILTVEEEQTLHTKYGSNFSVKRNDDGTTEVEFRNVPVIQKDANYVAEVDFDVIPVNTEVKDATTGEGKYEGKTIEANVDPVSVSYNQQMFAFELGDDEHTIYALVPQNSDGTVNIPKNGPVSWEKLRIRTLSENEKDGYIHVEPDVGTEKIYTVTWKWDETVGDNTETRTYYVSGPAGSELTRPDNYGLYAWSPAVPDKIPVYNQVLTGTLTHTKHSYKAIMSDAGGGAIEVERLVCTVCGHSVEQHIEYQVTYRDNSYWSWSRNKTYILNLNYYTDEGGTAVDGEKPDDYTFRFYIPNLDPSKQYTVTRLDTDNGHTKVDNMTIDPDGYVVFTLNHFSLYAITEGEPDPQLTYDLVTPEIESGDTSLKSLEVGGVNVAIEADKYDYTVAVPSNHKKEVTFNVETTDEKASIEPTVNVLSDTTDDLTVAKGTLSFKVNAEPDVGDVATNGDVVVFTVTPRNGKSKDYTVTLQDADPVVDGPITSVTVDGDKTTVIYTYEDDEAGAERIVIVASYNENDRMIAVQRGKATNGAADAGDKTVKVEMGKLTLDDKGKVKVFLLDENSVPVCPAKVVQTSTLINNSSGTP